MPQARGTQTSIALYDETTYGQAPGTPSGRKLYVTKFGVASRQNLIDSATLGASRARARPARGNIDVAGALETEISAENIGWLLKHALGGLSTSGTGPYTHVFTLGDLPVGMVLEKDHGANISGAGRYERFLGCRIGMATWKFPREGYCTASYDIKGATSTLESAALDATLDDSGHTPFSAFSASIEEGGTPVAIITEAEIKLDNGLDDGIYAIGGQGKRRALPEGYATVTGSLTALFEDAGLLNKAINGTESSLKISLSRGTGVGSAGNEAIEFLVEQLEYERNSPPIEGPAGILLPLTFKAYRSGANNGLKITLKNALATL